MKHIKELLEKKLNNSTENLTFLEHEKSEFISKINRQDNEIKLLKTQVQLAQCHRSYILKGVQPEKNAARLRGQKESGDRHPDKRERPT